MKRLLPTSVAMLSLATLIGCAADASESASSQNEAITQQAPSTVTPLSANDPALGFTADFRAFLAASPTYNGFDFPRSDLASGNGYGGRVTAGAPVTHDPIVFVHGNSDQGIGGTGALVWGSVTATIPGENGQLKLATGCGHFQSKTGTAAAQIAIVSKHTTAGAPKTCL